MVLLILALIWAAALLPPMIRMYMDRSPVSSIGQFNKHLRILQSTSPLARALADSPDDMPHAWVVTARRLAIQRRRRFVAKLLLASAVVTLLVGLVPALRSVLILHVVVDTALVAYMWGLAQSRKREVLQGRHVTPAVEEPIVADQPLTQTAAL